MLWHCKRFIIFYQNEKKYSPNLITKALGYMHMFFLRYIIEWDFKKYPKKYSKTSPWEKKAYKNEKK